MKYFDKEFSVKEKTSIVKGALSLDLPDNICRLLMHDIARVSEIRRPHDLVMDASIMPRDYRRNRYHQERMGGKLHDSFTLINEQYPIFEFGKKYDYKNGIAQPVTITSWANEILSDLPQVSNGSIIDVSGTVYKTPLSSRQATLSDGRRVKGDWSIPAEIIVDIESIYPFIEKNGSETSTELATRLYAVGLYEIYSSCGFLPQNFRQTAQGRHFATGYNLQNCKKEIREALLKNNIQYDIINCHATISRQTAKRQGISTPELDRYDSDSSGYRSMLSSDIGCTKGQIKTAILILLNGGKLTGVSMKEEMRQHFDIASSDKRLKKLSVELNKVGDYLINSAVKHKGKIINSIGFGIPISSSRAQKIAHLYQSIEAQANMACLAVHNSVILPIHDGYICSDEEDIELAEYAMYSATGIRFRLTKSVV